MQAGIQMPDDGIWILKRLREYGYVAYAVGGCVRDALLGRTPHDWDFCTEATPEQILFCFSDMSCITIGQRHGTIGVLRNEKIYEITTFRKESSYQDHRHPDAVVFTDSLYIDLQRRDFTINAMAYHPQEGIIDPFQGQADLQQQCLRCVGNPEERFEEDALRILRGLRFAATYGFSIQKETAIAMQKCATWLSIVSVERIFLELNRIVTAPFGAEKMQEQKEVLFVVLPELKCLDGFQQYHPRHEKDVLQHTLQVLQHCDNTDDVLCWAALFHDIGKPSCFQRDETGIGHFYKHEKVGAKLAKQICSRLKIKTKKATAIVALVEAHEFLPIDEKRVILRKMQMLGEAQTRRLLKLREADLLAQNPLYAENDLQALRNMQVKLEQIQKESACFSIRHLCVNGNDLLGVGVPEGKAIGKILQLVLEAVINGTLQNEKTEILQWVKEQLLL